MGFSTSGKMIYQDLTSETRDIYGGHLGIP